MGVLYKPFNEEDLNMMTDEQIHATVLALEVAETLLRDCPRTYEAMEMGGLIHIYEAARQRGLTLSEVARLLRCTNDEAAERFKRVKVVIGE